MPLLLLPLLVLLLGRRSSKKTPASRVHLFTKQRRIYKLFRVYSAEIRTNKTIIVDPIKAAAPRQLLFLRSV